MHAPWHHKNPPHLRIVFAFCISPFPSRTSFWPGTLHGPSLHVPKWTEGFPHRVPCWAQQLALSAQIQYPLGIHWKMSKLSASPLTEFLRAWLSFRRLGVDVLLRKNGIQVSSYLASNHFHQFIRNAPLCFFSVFPKGIRNHLPKMPCRSITKIPVQMFDAIDGTFMPFSCDARIVFIAIQEGLRKFQDSLSLEKMMHLYNEYDLWKYVYILKLNDHGR